MSILKRMLSLTLDAVTVFGMAAEILRLLATFLDAVKNLYQYPEK